MQKIGNVRWDVLLLAVASRIEKKHHVRIAVDKAILFDVGRTVRSSLEALGLTKPNVAKIAGQVAFWLCRLKPLQIANDSPNTLLTVNELAALYVGLALCATYKDDNAKPQPVAIPPRLFRDWVHSFRYHDHSPQASMLAFELLTCAD